MNNKEYYFTKEFISEIMNARFKGEVVSIEAVKRFEIDNSASILVTLTSASSDEFIGHYGIEVDYSIDQTKFKKKMVMKVKPHGRAISDMLAGLSNLCSEELYKNYHPVKEITGFQNTHDKEINIYKTYNFDFFPEIFGYYVNEKNNLYIILMEYFENPIMLNSVMDTQSWDYEKINLGISAIIKWTEVNYNNTKWYTELYNDSRDINQIEKLIPCWHSLLNNASINFPELYNSDLCNKLKFGITNFIQLYSKTKHLPKSIIHNDFNPRNAFFKKNEGELRICIYDWELAFEYFPVYDLIEFLSFTSSTINEKQIDDFFNNLYHSITEKLDDSITIHEYYNTALLSAYDFGLHRLGMYMMAHSVSNYPFIPHLVKNYEKILNYILVKSQEYNA